MSLSKDLVVGSIILCLLAFLWFMTTTFDTDPLGMSQGMAATAMPRILIATIAGLTVLMMVQSLIGQSEPVGAFPPWQVAGTAALLALVALSFTTIGLPLSFFAVCAIMPLLWGSRNYKTIAIFSVALPAAIYIVFKILLGLRLPMGPLSSLGL